MKKLLGVILPYCLFLLLGSMPVAWSGPPHSSLEYNPQAVVTVTGIITALDPAVATNLPEPVFLTLDTPQGKVKVFLGPNWFVAEQGMNFAILDRLQVTGAKLIDQGRVVIFAGQVRKGDRTWQIRDEQGFPLWTGRRKPPE